jgi:hypothetical protein
MSEREERIGRSVTKTIVEACFTGSLKIGRLRAEPSQEPKGSFRTKHSQTKLAGQVLQHSAEVITTVPWRSRQQRHRERKEIAE